jgi:hypothetical protein
MGYSRAVRSSRLKKLVADYALDIQMLKEITTNNGNARSETHGGQAFTGTFRAESAENLQTDWFIDINLAL